MTVRTQTRYPTTVVSDDAVGTLPWSDPDKAEVEDNDPATATGPGTTEYLLATGYGFGLLSTAVPLTALARPRRRSPVAFATITHVDGTDASVFNTSGNSLVVDVPDGTQAGDVMVAVVKYRAGSTGDWNVPAGWALIDRESYSDTTQTLQVAAFYRVAEDDEPDDYTFTHGGSNSTNWRRGVIDTWRNVNPAAPLASDVTSTNGTGTSHTATSVTTTVANAMLLAAFDFGITPGATSTPSGMSVLQSLGAEVTGALIVFNQTIATAGATGNRSLTTANDTGTGRIMFALAPKPNSAIDSAVRLVVDDVIGDGDYASPVLWATGYQTDDLGPISLFGVSVSDVNASGFGTALSADVPDGGDAEVDALPLQVTYDIAVDVTITAPAGGTLGAPNAAITWDAAVDSSAITQNDYRVRLYALPALTLVYDSGTVVGATQAHTIGSGTPTLPWAAPADGQALRIRVDVTEDGTADPEGTGDPISGSATIDCITDWTLPTAPTGLAAVAVTEAP